MRKRVALLLVLVFLTASCIIVSEPAFSQTQIVENSWERKYPMQQARSRLRAAAVNGKIYAIGGATLTGAVGTNEEYDPETDRWTYKTPKPTPRGFGIAVYKNKIYCIGYDVTEVYDPITDKWENRTPMPTPRHSLDANVVDGKIYLIGGYDPSLPYGGAATNINEVYDPETDTWSTKAPMLAAVKDYASAVVSDKIYIIVGNLNQIYDTKTDSWSYGAPAPSTMLSGVRAGVTSGVDAPVRIYVFVGMQNFFWDFYLVRVYDPETDSWKIGADIPTGRRDFGVAVLDDLFYVIGGVTSSWSLPFDPISTDTKYATNERYTPFGYGTIPPVVDLMSPQNQTYNVTNVTLTFTVNKAVSWMGYCLDRQENVTVTGNTTLVELPNGLHNVTVFVRDRFENYGVSETAFFTIELPPPEPFPTALVTAASVATVIVVGVGLLFYFKKRKH